jgi:hypothetical protein
MAMRRAESVSSLEGLIEAVVVVICMSLMSLVAARGLQHDALTYTALRRILVLPLLRAHSYRLGVILRASSRDFRERCRCTDVDV